MALECVYAHTYFGVILLLNDVSISRIRVTITANRTRTPAVALIDTIKHFPQFRSCVRMPAIRFETQKYS